MSVFNIQGRGEKLRMKKYILILLVLAVVMAAACGGTRKSVQEEEPVTEMEAEQEIRSRYL